MCSLLLGSLPVGLVGCKDYDGDIKELDNKTGNLSSQISTLQTALDAAKSAADAAGNDAKAAAAKADAATQEAALAKQAVEEAKAEAIQAAIDEIKAANFASNDDLAALSGKIEGIETGLSKIEADFTESQKAIAELNKQISAMDVQIKALENLKTEVAKIAELSQKVAVIDDLTTQLNAVKADAAANKADIKTINTELGKISGQITTAVNNAVNSLAGILSQRLTSVTLVPELYIGGIPTIEFKSAKYTKQVYANNKWSNATTGTTQYIITNNETKAQYRLNPGTLKDEDINISGMAYVTKVATSRADDPVVVKVASAKVENNGLLTVNLGKTNTASLNLSGNKIYTVSLKVPVAAKHLFEGEASADVYSEFTRLSETYFEPELRFVDRQFNVAGSADVAGHLINDSTVLYNSAASAMVVKNIVYNKTFDLNTLVQGCEFISPSTHAYLTLAEMEKYGLGIKYAVATRKYEPSSTDQTNQQAFAKIDGSILTPIASSTAVGNENIIGKEPIIRATLYDKNNNNVIEVGYFKVKFTAEDMTPTVFNETVADNGTPCAGASHNFTWDWMAQKILENIGANGMSKEEFTRVYDRVTVSANPVNQNTTLTVDIINGQLQVATPIMSWSVDPVNLGVLHVGNNAAQYKRTVTFSNSAGLYADVVINLTWNVTTPVGAIALGTVDPIKWNGNTMKVTVVPMGIPYDGTQTAVYNTNILEARNKPYVTGLASCANYNIALAPATEQPYAYYGQIPLTLQSGFTAWGLTAANQNSLTAVNYVIENTTGGKNLASKGGVVKVNFSSDINGLTQNRFVFGTINLDVVKILQLTTETAKGITDNSAAVSMNISDNLVIKDAYGNVVARTNSTANPYAADYWKFYVVEEPVYDASNILVASSPTATTGSSLASLNMTAVIDASTGTLTFQNNGSAIANDAYLLVPVKVAHKWGVLEGKVAVPLKKKL